MAVSKLLIAGTRTFTDYELLKFHLRSFSPTEIVTGCSEDDIDLFNRGVKVSADLLGYRYAVEHSIPVKLYPPDWNSHGLSAGPIRNKQMAEYCDFGICFWDGKSRGTKNMISNMKKLGKEIRVVEYKIPKLGFL